jgi:hypothetical protein
MGTDVLPDRARVAQEIRNRVDLGPAIVTLADLAKMSPSFASAAKAGVPQIQRVNEQAPPEGEIDDQKAQDEDLPFHAPWTLAGRSPLAKSANKGKEPVLPTDLTFARERPGERSRRCSRHPRGKSRPAISTGACRHNGGRPLVDPRIDRRGRGCSIAGNRGIEPCLQGDVPSFRIPRRDSCIQPGFRATGALPRWSGREPGVPP